MTVSPAQVRGRDQYDLRDTVSFTHGTHYMKGGITAGRQNFQRRVEYNMDYSFSGNYLVNAAAEFIMGWPTGFSGGEPLYTPVRKQLVHFFFQDDWKVNPRLSVNLGLRYEPDFPGYKTDERVILFKPFAQSRYSNYPSGLISPGDPDFIGRSGREGDFDNFAPRLGMSYRLNQDGRRVLRGAWGIFYDSNNLNFDTGFSGGNTSFPFFNFLETRFDLGFPAQDAWLDPYAYRGLPKPNFAVPLDPALAIFDPRAANGDYQPDHQYGVRPSIQRDL